MAFSHDLHHYDRAPRVYRRTRVFGAHPRAHHAGSDGFAVVGTGGLSLISSFILSLYRVNLANPEQGQPFVGLGNYLFAFQQPEFWYAVQRTFYFT